MGLFDIFCNAVAGAATATEDHKVRGGDRMRANSHLWASGRHRESLEEGRSARASFWGGYAGQTADDTRPKWSRWF